MSKQTTAETIAEQARDYYHDTICSAITAEDIEQADAYTNEHLSLTVEVMDALGIFHANNRLLVAIAQAMRWTLEDIEAQTIEEAHDRAAAALVDAYAEAIGEPTPAYMAKSARLVFLAQEAGGENPAPVHYDAVRLMQKVVTNHESDPDALRELFEDLKNGAVYGHQVNNVTYPFFWENIGIHGGYIKWNHYGASANSVSMNDLAFVVFTIFKTTPRAFMQEYERRA